MITAVSITLYAASVFFAATVGVTAERFKDGKAGKPEAAYSVALTAVPFILAAILQVFAASTK